MKKLTCILLSLLLALALTSCDVAEVLGSLGDLVNEAMSNAQESADTEAAGWSPVGYPGAQKWGLSYCNR